LPLVFGGTASIGDDYRLSKPSPKPRRVSYRNLGSRNSSRPPTITFKGPSAQSATVILTAIADSAEEGESEAVTVTLGTPGDTPPSQRARTRPSR